MMLVTTTPQRKENNNNKQVSRYHKLHDAKPTRFLQTDEKTTPQAINQTGGKSKRIPPTKQEPTNNNHQETSTNKQQAYALQHTKQYIPTNNPKILLLQNRQDFAQERFISLMDLVTTSNPTTRNYPADANMTRDESNHKQGVSTAPPSQQQQRNQHTTKCLTLYDILGMLWLALFLKTMTTINNAPEITEDKDMTRMRNADLLGQAGRPQPYQPRRATWCFHVASAQIPAILHVQHPSTCVYLAGT